MTNRDVINVLLVWVSVFLGYGFADQSPVAVVLLAALQVACYVFTRTCIPERKL